MLPNVIQDTLFKLSEIEEYFQLLYHAQMKFYPSRVRAARSGSWDRNRQWIFVGEREDMKSVATLSSLFGILADPAYPSTYYTPNGYYRRDRRLTENLRWLNAFVFDIDDSEESLPDIMDRISVAGLPAPTAVIQTPSGGYHITYVFKEPLRATDKVIRLYTAIMTHMASDLGSDPAAIGANRIFRVPTKDTLLYFESKHTYSFEFFKEWREINHPFESSLHTDLYVKKGDIMSSAALQKLLNSPCSEGLRDRTCFTLVLAMKASEWPIDRAEEAIGEWHQAYCSQEGSPFTYQAAIRKVRYVYHRSNLKAPTAEVIRELSGLPFQYAAYKLYEGPKQRQERIRTHYSEWIADFYTLFEEGNTIVGSQAEIAKRISCPLSTFKEVLSRLISAGKIAVVTKRGRGGSTTITLLESYDPKPTKETIKDLKDETILYVVDFKEKTVIQTIKLSTNKKVNDTSDQEEINTS